MCKLVWPFYIFTWDCFLSLSWIRTHPLQILFSLINKLSFSITCVLVLTLYWCTNATVLHTFSSFYMSQLVVNVNLIVCRWAAAFIIQNLNMLNIIRYVINIINELKWQRKFCCNENFKIEKSHTYTPHTDIYYAIASYKAVNVSWLNKERKTTIQILQYF